MCERINVTDIRAYVFLRKSRRCSACDKFFTREPSCPFSLAILPSCYIYTLSKLQLEISGCTCMSTQITCNIQNFKKILHISPVSRNFFELVQIRVVSAHQKTEISVANFLSISFTEIFYKFNFLISNERKHKFL